MVDTDARRRCLGIIKASDSPKLRAFAIKACKLALLKMSGDVSYGLIRGIGEVQRYARGAISVEDLEAARIRIAPTTAVPTVALTRAVLLAMSDRVTAADAIECANACAWVIGWCQMEFHDPAVDTVAAADAAKRTWDELVAWIEQTPSG